MFSQFYQQQEIFLLERLERLRQLDIIIYWLILFVIISLLFSVNKIKLIQEKKLKCSFYFENLDKTIKNWQKKKCSKQKTILLIKLAQLIDKQLQNSQILYRSIQRNLIRQTQNTSFSQQIQKLYKKQYRNKHSKKHKKHKKQKQLKKKSKILSKFYNKKFKRSYQNIFYNLFVKIIQKTYQHSVKQINFNQAQLRTKRQRSQFSIRKINSYNRIQRLNFLIKFLFNQRELVKNKQKVIKKKIVKFLKTYQQIKCGINPKDKLNLIMKNSMMDILLPEQENMNRIQEEKIEENQEFIIEDNDYFLLYQTIEQRVLKKLIQNFPEKVYHDPNQSTLNITNQLYSTQKPVTQIDQISQARSLSLLKPLTKISAAETQRKNKNHSSNKFQVKQSKAQLKKENSFLAAQKSKNYNPLEYLNFQLPKVAPKQKSKPITYQEYYKQFNQRVQDQQSDRDYINKQLIHESIQNDSGRQRAYQMYHQARNREGRSLGEQRAFKQNLKWQIRSYIPNTKTHLPYFHVISYFKQQDLGPADRISKKQESKQQEDEVVQINDVQVIQSKQQIELKSIKPVYNNDQDQNQKLQQNKTTRIQQTRSEKGQGQLGSSFEQKINQELDKNKNGNMKDLYRSQIVLTKAESQDDQFSNQRKYEHKLKRQLNGKIQLQNLSQNSQINNSQNQQQQQIQLKNTYKIKQLYPRAYGMPMTLLYQYNPNLSLPNKAIYFPVHQIQNAKAVQQVNSPILNNQKIINSFNDISETQIKGLQAFGWLELEKQEAKIQQAIIMIQDQNKGSSRQNSIVLEHQQTKSQRFSYLDAIQLQNPVIKYRGQIQTFVSNYFHLKTWNKQQKKHLAELYVKNQSLNSVKKQLLKKIKIQFITKWLKQKQKQYTNVELKQFMNRISKINYDIIKSRWVLHRLYDLVSEIFYDLRNSVLQSRSYNNPNNINLYNSYKIFKKLLPIPTGVSIESLQGNSLLSAQVRQLNLNQLPSSPTWFLSRPSFPILLKPNAIEINLYLLRFYAEGSQNQPGYVQKIGNCLQRIKIRQKLAI